MVVTGSRTEEPLPATPFSASVLTTADIGAGRPTLSLGESLAQVPGVFVSSRGNYAQDSRLSIRGFGGRAAFGVRGIRVVIDGIPLTLPDGQTPIDLVDLANVGRIEVLRGPAGSLYGNAAGGVLSIESKLAPATPRAEVFNLVGAFETWKLAASGQGRFGGTDVSVFASRTETGGYREQSGTERIAAQARTVTRIADGVRWMNVVHYNQIPFAEDPGGLTPEDFDSAPRSAAGPNRQFATGETSSQLQLGSRLVADAGRHHRFELSGHAGIRDFVNAIPARTVAFTRNFFGGLLVYRWQEPTWLHGHRLAIGGEVQAQVDRRSNQGNRGGRPDGRVLLLQDEQAVALGAFAQESLTLFDGFSVLASARYDRTDFELSDDLRDARDTSGQRSFDQLTAQAGLSVRPSAWFDGPSAPLDLELFGNVAQAFETPTLTELVNSAPDGGLSPSLDAQKALSYEAGARLRAPGFAAEAVGFYLDIEDELVPGEDELNRTIFTNAGASRRAGAELSVRWQAARQLELLGAYTWLLATYEDEGRAGKLLPGLPEHRLFGRARYDDGRIHATFELEWVDERFADDANLVASPAYALAELRVGLRFALGPEWTGDLVVGARNLFDVPYADGIRPNAFGRRYFESGAPLNLFGALTVTFDALDRF